MRMHGFVVLHPAVDESERCGSARGRADPDVVTLEGFDEGLGHAVAFWAFDRREARHQIECHGDVDRLIGGEDRAVIGQPSSRRSIRLDRATPSVSAIVFTGYLRAAASATATSVFLLALGR